MNQNRRSFLKNAAILSGAAGLTNMLPFSIKKAMAIDAAPGSTYLDAEHVVFLMQENRSFDHMFGTMKGVRGFNDPRAKTLPDGDKVWIQKNEDKEAYAPFHLDINKTKITWQGGLPHDWPDQTGARNGGKYDRWILEKSAMTLGHYDRSDVPFYYALADAFTTGDHYFCSSLTGTTPNRLFFWTGNIRPNSDPALPAAVRNSNAESRNNTYVNWSSFPELMEDHGVSWKVYQNELWTVQLPDDIDYWLGNYGDNALEYVKSHQVKLSAYFRKNGDHTGKQKISPEVIKAQYEKLSQREKNLIDKTFTTNIDQRDYLERTPFSFTNDQGEQQSVDIPKGDIFHQFRTDVKDGKLPTVSWLVAPQSFSDHTSTPLYGTWYVSQVLDILTQNPEIWKKTIFILNYDENDGYFDHLTPFVVPKPGDPTAGKVSEGLATGGDYEAKHDSPIGLGYRVPLIIASPWSKGGYVNSQISDHTSTLQFLEHFIEHKTHKPIRSPHISPWRRAVCGDLRSFFRPYNGEKFPLPEFLKKDVVITHIQNAKTKPRQAVPPALSATEIQKINQFPAHDPACADILPGQEKGTRPACALPYHITAECQLDHDLKLLKLDFALKQADGAKGVPFNVYTPGAYNGETGKCWFYTVLAGKSLSDQLELNGFEDHQYDLRLNGPNGFYRAFRGDQSDPELTLRVEEEPRTGLRKGYTGNLVLQLDNKGDQPLDISLEDNSYGLTPQQLRVAAGAHKKLVIRLNKSQGWYDFTVKTKGFVFSRRYAGHAETGKESITDPYMGGVLG